MQFRRHRRHRFNPWVRKFLWRRKWQPALVFLPEKFHGQRKLAGNSPWGLKESDTTKQVSTCAPRGQRWKMLEILSTTRIWHQSVQFSCCHVRLLVTPWTAAWQTSLSITNTWSLLKLMSIESVMSSNHLILCHPLLLPSIFPRIRVFSNELILLIRWPNYWSFSFSISPSSENSGLISFRIDYFYLLAVQRTLRSLLQHHNSKASILWCSAFFMVQLSYQYMTTGKTIALTRHTFVCI